jgi:hypothetical protein
LNGKLKEDIASQVSDLVVLLIILLKGAIVGAAVFYTGLGLVWIFHLAPKGAADKSESVLTSIDAVSSILLYLAVVIKDIWSYIGRR